MKIDISKFEACRVLVVGDLMIDEYVWGDVDRVSPEAPVQVVSINSEDYSLGGAGKVINNIIALGGKVSAVGVIGEDIHGQLLFNKLNEFGVDTEGVVQEPDRPTTRKTRIIAGNQHILRIDRETRSSISKQTLEAVTRCIENKIHDADVVLISDYAKGLITKTLLIKLITFAQKHKKITIADQKGLDFFKYSGVSLLTPNKKEAALASGIEIVDEPTLLEAGAWILKSVDVKKLLVTCGKDGMVLFDRRKAPYKISTDTHVHDVSGAGDTVLAVYGLALASGASFEESATLANTAAGIAVSKVGTATVSKKELAAALRPFSDGTALKYKDLSELPVLIKELKKKGRRLVLTNGCFDLLHAGHIMLFDASKKQGDVLIVAIDDDESVKSLKGSGRPVINERERVRILSALDSVDYVVAFSSDQLKHLIEIVRPDVLTKGSNYTTGEVLGREIVERFGGRVELIPVTENISSTRIINNIRSSNSTE
ncbi:MAG: D-glycero-beta-D-manno-heptose-7-phosphate kinase [Deltaproteobacteria bacterium]|nr:D-glycero-beta-D-manno-heptose-7-phosphate kinase [Deltaproteobacteria bacterium]